MKVLFFSKPFQRQQIVFSILSIQWLGLTSSSSSHNLLSTSVRIYFFHKKVIPAVIFSIVFEVKRQLLLFFARSKEAKVASALKAVTF